MGTQEPQKTNHNKMSWMEEMLHPAKRFPMLMSVWRGSSSLFCMSLGFRKLVSMLRSEYQGI